MTDICWASHSCYPQHTHTDSPKPGAWVCTEGRHGWVRAGTLDFGCGLAVPTALDPLCVPSTPCGAEAPVPALGCHFIQYTHIEHHCVLQSTVPLILVTPFKDIHFLVSCDPI